MDMEFEAIYENMKPQNTNRITVGPQTQSRNRTEAKESRRWFVLITVGLGIFCALLVVTLIVLYSHLTAERDRMEMRYKNLKEYLDTHNYDSMSGDNSDESDTLMESISGSCRYFISCEKKNWTDSRRFCRDRGGDLVIINTEKEQRYISSVITDTMWIGLSDMENEGVMQWVDNSAVDVKFWISGEPNDAREDEDCVHMVSSYPPKQNWNDQPCTEERRWICEN
ncbi:putative C-type lectin domain family 4 member E [Triplophysa rosa]|uniref:C-type lectin domain family 4 member E n=2 Tax=Triplophysa rosa TaxID=992332 RepID=A0A9W8C9D6_TRIRA|nr:putative C-type lectin domain family 4 member E [Triplophysa rosa]